MGGGCVAAGGAAGGAVAVGAFSCVTVGGGARRGGCSDASGAAAAPAARWGALGEEAGVTLRRCRFEFSIAAMASGALRGSLNRFPGCALALVRNGAANGDCVNHMPHTG